MNDLQSPPRNLLTQYLTMPVKGATFLTIFWDFHPSLLFLSGKKQTGPVAAAKNQTWTKQDRPEHFQRIRSWEKALRRQNAKFIPCQSKKIILHESFQFVTTALKLCSPSADIMNSRWLHSNVKSVFHCCWSSST